MDDHNEWRRAQGLQPLPSKAGRLTAEPIQVEEPSEQHSGHAQAALPAAASGSDSLDRVLSHLALVDDDSSDSEEEECLLDHDDSEAPAGEAPSMVGRLGENDQPVQLQTHWQTGDHSTPADGFAGLHPYYGYVSPFEFAEPTMHADGASS
jgi:hypothetical protein